MTETVDTRDCMMCGVNHGYGAEDNKACLLRQIEKEEAAKQEDSSSS